MHIKIHQDTIHFGRRGLTVSFQRTLRIPDDGKSYPLPPGLGRFPLRRVDDYATRVPAEWVEHGGIFMPMYQREAMWISFGRRDHRPRAVKVGVGKVCALTGKPWSNTLGSSPQDYLVTPPQPWLDGIYVRKGAIRQFVAMQLGQGYTVEGQVTGEEVHGGLQLMVFEPKPGRFPEPPPRPRRSRARSSSGGGPPALACAAPPCPAAPGGTAMGLAAGGRMEQKIYPDPHGLDTWDPNGTGRLFVHICNSMQWREITGEEPPSTPVSAKSYATHGLPWFDLYDEAAATLSASETLASVASVKEHDVTLFGTSQQDDASIAPGPVESLDLVRDGSW